MKRGIDIIRALLDGDESEQIERYWALRALTGEPDSSLRDEGPRGRREAWLEWRIRDQPLFVDRPALTGGQTAWTYPKT